MKLFTGVGLGWLGRRVLDWGGWLGSAVTGAMGLYSALPPTGKHAVDLALNNHWQDITLGSLAPIALLVFAQWRSYKATVKPAIVASDGTKKPLDQVSTAARDSIEIIATATPPADGPVVARLKRVFGK